MIKYYIWSKSQNTMVLHGFTTKYVYISKDGTEPLTIGNVRHWTWNDDDELYYCDDVDDTYRYSVPSNGKTSHYIMVSRKYQYRYRVRILVIPDKI